MEMDEKWTNGRKYPDMEKIAAIYYE